MGDIPYPNGLAACMARVGITDPRLAEAVGTTKQQIYKLRHGERKLTVQWAKRLAAKLDCTWQELIEGPSEPTDPQRAAWIAAYDRLSPSVREFIVRSAQDPVQGDDKPPAPMPIPPPTRMPPRPPPGPRPGGSAQEKAAKDLRKGLTIPRKARKDGEDLLQ